MLIFCKLDFNFLFSVIEINIFGSFSEWYGIPKSGMVFLISVPRAPVSVGSGARQRARSGSGVDTPWGKAGATEKAETTEVYVERILRGCVGNSML